MTDDGPTPSAAPEPDTPAEPTRRLSRRAVVVGGLAAAGGAAVATVAVIRSRDTGPTPTPTSTTGPPSTPEPPRTEASTPASTEPDPDRFDLADFGVKGDGTDESVGVAAALRAAIERSRTLNADPPPDQPERFATLHLGAAEVRCPTLPVIDVDAPIAVRGDSGAALNALGLDRDEPMLRCTASIDVEGVGFRGGTEWFDFASIAHDFELLRIVGCTFDRVSAPAYAWGGGTLDHGPDRMEVERNLVSGFGSAPGTAIAGGFLLAFHRWGSASVRDNVITGVHQQGLRLGDQERGARSYADRSGLVCTGNTVSGVWGREKASGIIAQASAMRIEGNTVRDVSSGDGGPVGGFDTEGIYTKGFDVEIRGNTLVDAGRTQAQITVKSDDTLVVGNHVTFDRARAGNAIRLEGVRGTVRGNTIVGSAPGQDVISVQAEPTDDVVIVADNVISGGPARRGIVVDRRAEVHVTGNRVEHLAAEGPLILVRTDDDGDTTAVVIRGNVLAASPEASAVEVSVDRAVVGSVTVVDNRFTDVARATRLVAYDGGRITRVDLQGNDYVGVDPTPEVAGDVPPVRPD